jgi:hypothetical protein
MKALHKAGAISKITMRKVEEIFHAGKRAQNKRPGTQAS